MEAIGAATAILQLLEISIKIFSACQVYYIGVKDARKDISRLTTEITSLSDVLQQLQDILDSNDSAETGGSKFVVAGILTREDGPLRGCERELTALAEKLAQAEGKGGKLRSLTWPFKEKEVQKAVEEIERQKASLELCLVVGNTYVPILSHQGVLWLEMLLGGGLIDR
jgi:hypothetical protein